MRMAGDIHRGATGGPGTDAGAMTGEAGLHEAANERTAKRWTMRGRMRHGHGFSLRKHFLSAPDGGNGVGPASGGGRSSTGGRTMTGRGARKVRTSGVAWLGSGRRRQGPFRELRANPGTAASALRHRNRPGEAAWPRAPGRGAEELAGATRAAGAARCVRGGGLGSITLGITVACSGIRALRDGSVRYRLARDNCSYREPKCQIRHFRRATRKPPCLVPAILAQV